MLVFLILAWGIWGAVADSQYRKLGGIGPAKSDRIVFSIAVTLSVVILVLIGVSSGAAALGSATAYTLAFLFGLWELGRWRMRRKTPVNSIQERKKPQEPQKGIIYTKSEIRAFQDRKR